MTEPHVSQGGRRRFGGVHGYGHASSPHAPVHADFSAHPSSSLPSTPDSVDWSEFCPPVMDQGGTSSCVGHSTAGAICAAYACAGNPLGFCPSPDDIYKGARCEDRAASTPPSHTLPALTDDGADPQQATVWCATIGVRPMGPRASDGRLSDVDAATVNAEPSFLAIEKDGAKLAPVIHRINATGAARVLQFRKALAGRSIIRFAIDVDSAFENADGSKPVSAPNPTDILGGHAIYACGYRTTADGKTIGKLVNSWGVGIWTPDGTCEFDESFLQAMSQIDVVTAPSTGGA